MEKKNRRKKNIIQPVEKEQEDQKGMDLMAVPLNCSFDSRSNSQFTTEVKNLRRESKDFIRMKPPSKKIKKN